MVATAIGVGPKNRACFCGFAASAREEVHFLLGWPSWRLVSLRLLEATVLPYTVRPTQKEAEGENKGPVVTPSRVSE